MLQKLGITRDRVDEVLAPYLGEAGRQRRQAIGTRADRCGVFASSATISDKNQGIPLDVALATTLKSEVLKACRKLPAGFDTVYLLGRVFRWAFARDCARDFLADIGVENVRHDAESTCVLEALADASGSDGGSLPAPDAPTAFLDGSKTGVREYAGFAEIRQREESAGRYLRLVSGTASNAEVAALASRPLVVGLDVGSTMAKAVFADADDGTPLYFSAYSNAGDTMETVKCLLRDLALRGLDTLRVRGIGVTGSARYQVQQALMRIYPSLADRLTVLVENYAHARGSIDLAREHVARLAASGVDVNRQFCTLVDIGGEDTKVSTIALDRAELFANAMNVKCSAGTGSLMDTLGALFGLPGVAAGCAEAYAAPRSRQINATCAVFLMENARKLQAEGVPRDEILAAANWAIVENMARTLWRQIEIPPRSVVLLHGQTMLSEPLPLAVTDRLQDYLGAPVYSLVPPHPGHRACIGLVRTLLQVAPLGAVETPLVSFLDARFEKKIIECRGAVCGDDQARCHRTSLGCRGADGARFSFTLGGCTAINELFGRKGGPAPPPPPRDAYKEIWDFIASAQPHSNDANRLVLARSFCVSEWAFLFASVFAEFGIPVHVDEIRESDLLGAQTHFHIDTCAPHMGAVGQYRRLAGEPHGIILVPQIEDLPTEGLSRGHTCTLNQGGVAVGRNLAGLSHPEARFHEFAIRLAELDADVLTDQVGSSFKPVFEHYGLAPTPAEVRRAFEAGLAAHRGLRQAASDRAAELAREALAEGRQVALVVGREYVLNPGIYDSSVRRLLRDKGLTAIPSYVLDVALDPEFSHIYWRNPHAIVSILKAVSERRLHERVRHQGLADVFRQIETRANGPLLPVVQVSTFSCGPDSVTAPLVADIMRRRPFLLLQSDAVLKELAHLENRVNTYMKQLELGLHGELRLGEEAVELHSLDRLSSDAPLDRDRDVIYFPTLGDNREVSAVFRAAGFTCPDLWHPAVGLGSIIREGRRATGDAVCAPLAAVYGDLQRAVDDFSRKRAAGDPAFAGKTRLLYFDNQGDGPCRQGQYADVHALLVNRTRDHRRSDASARGVSLPGGGVLQFLVGQEHCNYDVGIEEWTLLRAYQGIIIQGVLHELYFAGGVRCRDAAEFAAFRVAHAALTRDMLDALEAFRGPGSLARRLLARLDGHSNLAALAKYFAYRLHGRDLTAPLSRFESQWIAGRALPAGTLRVHVSGEAYMRVAQAEQLFHALLAITGLGRFEMSYSPIWMYLEYLPEYRVLQAQDAIELRRTERARAATEAERRQADEAIRPEELQIRQAKRLQYVLRDRMAAPLYRAAGIRMPPRPEDLHRAAREILPTLRPHGELGLYVGEALLELRSGVDLFLNLAPTGCMVTSMGEVMTPKILQAAGRGALQSLFSPDGEIDEELLSLAVLRVVGPERATDAAGPPFSPALLERAS